MIRGATYQAIKARRLIRVRRRAAPELREAFEKGDLSLRQFDLLSHLSARQQKRVIVAKEREERDALIAAQVIAEILDSVADSRIRLADVGRQIRLRLQDAV
jgi:hypothetical protein